MRERTGLPWAEGLRGPSPHLVLPGRTYCVVLRIDATFVLFPATIAGVGLSTPVPGARGVAVVDKSVGTTAGAPAGPGPEAAIGVGRAAARLTRNPWRNRRVSLSGRHRAGVGASGAHSRARPRLDLQSAAADLRLDGTAIPGLLRGRRNEQAPRPHQRWRSGARGCPLPLTGRRPTESGSIGQPAPEPSSYRPAAVRENGAGDGVRTRDMQLGRPRRLCVTAPCSGARAERVQLSCRHACAARTRVSLLQHGERVEIDPRAAQPCPPRRA